MNAVPIWIQVLQALLTPAIALAVGVIGFLQWRTAHQKVVLDVFDRRLAIYEAVMELHDDYQRSSSPTGNTKIIARSLRKIERKAKFLFGDEVVESIAELRDAMWKVLPFLRKIEEEEDKEKRLEIVRAAQPFESRITAWHDRFPELCLPYMRMDQKRVRTPAEWLSDRNAERLSHADEKQR